MKHICSYAAAFLFLDCVPRIYWAEVVDDRAKGLSVTRRHRFRGQTSSTHV